jgi:hypothetical protein
VPISAAAGAATPKGDMFSLLYVVQPGFSAVTAFSGVPQQYQDLMIVTYGRTNAVTNGYHAHTIDNVRNTAGTSMGNICSSLAINGNGTSVGVYQAALQGGFPLAQLGMLSGSWITSVVHFFNYSSTTTHKTIIAEVTNDTNGVGASGAGARYLLMGNIQTNDPIGGFNISTYNGTYGWTNETTQAVYGVKRLT